MKARRIDSRSEKMGSSTAPTVPESPGSRAIIAGALAAMDGRIYGNHGAKAAIEIALHDLTGLADQKPVHALLGGKIRDRMALLGVIAGGDFDGDLRDTEDMIEQPPAVIPP